MKNIALNATKNFVRLGSFWYKMMEGEARQHAKTLSSLSLNNNLIAQINNVISNVENKADELYATNFGYTFDNAYNVMTISLVEEDIVLDKPACLQDAEDNGITLSTWYVIPFTLNLELFTISGMNDEELINGVDFRQTSNYLWFKKNPLELFPYNHMVLNGKWKRGSYQAMSVFTALTGTANCPVGINAQYIANYKNGYNQSARDFERFINATANAVFVPVDSEYQYNLNVGDHIKVHILKETSTGKMYTLFTNYEDYSENDYQKDQTLYAGHALYAPIQVLTKKNKDFITLAGYSDESTDLNTPLIHTIYPLEQNRTYAWVGTNESLFKDYITNPLICIIDLKSIKCYALNDYEDVDWHQDTLTKLKNLYAIIKENFPIGYYPIVRVKDLIGDEVKIIDYGEYITYDQ